MVGGEGVRFEPFGESGAEAASAASTMATILAWPVDRAELLVERPDYDALNVLCDLDETRQRLRPERHLITDEVQGNLDRLWTSFYTALPFSEGERAWVIDTIQHSPRIITVEKTVDFVSDQEGEIVAEGVRRRVSGSELMRRWLAWRRETEEYAGQGTLAVARETLGRLERHLG